MLRLKPFFILPLASLLFACSHDVKILDSADYANFNADRLLIVDCLLPSSVRQLGTRLTYLGPRRVVKTSAIDCQIRGGEYVAADRANYQSALKVWMPLAKSGDAKAQTYVGEIYEKGLGIEPDYKKASEWYEKASAQGYDRAKMNLGYLYESGLGVKQDVVKAMNLYRDASGLAKGKLEYVSSVQIAERKAQKVAISQSNAQAIAAQRALAKSQQAADKLRKEIGQLNKELNKQLANTSAQSKREKQQIQQSIKVKQKAVIKQEKNVTQAKVTLKKASSPKQTSEINKETKFISPVVVSAGNAPTIEITSPPISSLRTAGKPTVTLSSSARNAMVKGSVAPADNIKSLQVNGSNASFDKQGNFSVSVPVQKKGSDVKIIAINQQDKQSEFGFVLVPGAGVVAESSSPLGNVKIPSLKGINFGKYYAVVIGNDNYTNLKPLKSSANDARAVANVLASKYGFRSIVVTNATRGKMLALFNSLRKKLTENDNLVIYYAGHGEIDASGKGYWQPIDAKKGNEYSWISNNQISDYLLSIKAKHIMVVADSCYSGTLSRTSIPRPSTESPAKRASWYKAVSQSKVRVVLSSGGVKPVLDTGGDNNHSVFASAFLKVLRNNSQVMEASGLYHAVKNQVSKSASRQGIEQVPLFSPVRFSGHEAGDFILVQNSQVAALKKDDDPEKGDYLIAKGNLISRKNRSQQIT